MLLGYFADGPWAHNALELIINSKDIEIAFICARFNNPDLFLKKKAAELGIEFIVEKDINSFDFQEKLRIYNCELFVSMSFNQIFKKSTFTIPSKGTINCHAGKLPFYRGRNVLNWALINDEKEFGITVHFVDEGIDTGDIIIQKTFPILEIDNYKTILEKSYLECPKLLVETIHSIIDGNFTRTSQKQFSEFSMYCSKRKRGDEIINWNKNSREIYNFIRALTLPGPCAQTLVDKIYIKIINSEFISNAPNYIGIPGTVLETFDNSFLVKTKDSYIKILDWESDIKIFTGLRFFNQE